MKGYAWNPWHGCTRESEGCKNCWLYRLDGKRGRDASVISRSKTAFDLPLKKDRQGQWKIPSDSEIATCFSSDFFLPQADEWRGDAWDVIRQRKDALFFIPTKRARRIADCLPSDWGEGYDNVLVAVSVENQRRADERLPFLLVAPLRHRAVLAAPLLEEIDLSAYLGDGKLEFVSVAGESYYGARECRFEWVEKIRDQCLKNGVKFFYHQTGSNFVKDGRRYRIPHGKEYEQARKAFQGKP